MQNNQLFNIIWQLASILFFLLSGIIAAFLTPGFIKKIVPRLTSITLMLLLFSIGFSLGNIEDLQNQIGQMGLQAALVSISACIGSIGVLFLLELIFSPGKERIKREKAHSRHNFSFKDIGLLLASLFAGVVIALLKIIPVTPQLASEIPTWVLYFLLILIGFDLKQQGMKSLRILKSPLALIVPIATISGSLLGAFILSIVTGGPLNENMGIAAGMGWYSLSSSILTSLDSPVLGATAFLSNVLRETLALITIPFLCRFGFVDQAVSIAGATSMDVTLPLLETQAGGEIAPLAIAHGLVISIAVPLLVPPLYTFFS